MIEFSSTQSNMLMSIAGYLIGYKGINSKTNAASLLGKIKNTEPLFASHTNALKDLGDKLTEVINNSGISGKSSKGGTSSTLNIVKCHLLLHLHIKLTIFIISKNELNCTFIYYIYS